MKKEQLFDATRQGLDIILDFCPKAAEAVRNPKKAFKLRSERTASAYLYPPRDGEDCWHVMDFGDGQRLSPIDIYMRKRGYSNHQFPIALAELAERYGISDRLDSRVNRPIIRTREATADEHEGDIHIERRDRFSSDELRVWGSMVKAEHLESLGWHPVVAYSRVKGGKVIERQSTENYPIFVQDCVCYDKDGNKCEFSKVYEPKNSNKSYRFWTNGSVPSCHIFGLTALQEAYYKNDDQKLDKVILVSGGSDAVNCLSMGYQPVWLSSETAVFDESQYQTLLKYARKVYYIPDIDSTGKKIGTKNALRFPEMATIWLPEQKLNKFLDNRGRRYKDLKDYVTLYPHKSDFDSLINNAKTACFWTKITGKDGKDNYHYSISPTLLGYYLGLNGFYTLHDENNEKPQYIRIQGKVVERVMAKDIEQFVSNWAEESGLEQKLKDAILHCKDMPTVNHSILKEVDLDFSSCTAKKQDIYFRNVWIKVTGDSIEEFRYDDMAGSETYVWKNAIIPHDYVNAEPMFSVSRNEDGDIIPSFRHDSNCLLMKYLWNTSRLYWRITDEQGRSLTDGQTREELQCMLSKMACIGYYMHRYKSASLALAAFCQDNKIGANEDERNGRSGKSILLFFLRSLSPIHCRIDASNPRITENRFIFDGIKKESQLVTVDECHRNLNYGFFFGCITDGFRVEEKGNHQFFLKFEDSPKMIFATNNVLKTHDPSIEGRLWTQVFSDYYHVKTKTNDYRETRSVRDDMGMNLFMSDYPEECWKLDIAFAVQCLQFYLSLPDNEKKIMSPTGNIDKREQLEAVGDKFMEWADEYFMPGDGHTDIAMNGDAAYNDFVKDTNNRFMQKQSFTRKLKRYCEFKGYVYNPKDITGKDKDGEMWRRRNGDAGQQIYIFIRTIPFANTSECTEHGLPF